MTRNEVMEFHDEVLGAKANRKGYVKGISQDFLMRVLSSFIAMFDELHDPNTWFLAMTKAYETASIDVDLAEERVEKLEKDLEQANVKISLAKQMSEDTKLMLENRQRMIEKLEGSPGRATRDEKADLKNYRTELHNLQAQIKRRVEESPLFKFIQDKLKKATERLSVHRDAMQTIHELASRLRDWGDDTRPLTEEEIKGATDITDDSWQLTAKGVEPDENTTANRRDTNEWIEHRVSCRTGRKSHRLLP